MIFMAIHTQKHKKNLEHEQNDFENISWNQYNNMPIHDQKSRNAKNLKNIFWKQMLIVKDDTLEIFSGNTKTI